MKQRKSKKTQNKTKKNKSKTQKNQHKTKKIQHSFRKTKKRVRKGGSYPEKRNKHKSINTALAASSTSLLFPDANARTDAETEVTRHHMLAKITFLTLLRSLRRRQAHALLRWRRVTDNAFKQYAEKMKVLERKSATTAPVINTNNYEVEGIFVGTQIKSKMDEIKKREDDDKTNIMKQNLKMITELSNNNHNTEIEKNKKKLLKRRIIRAIELKEVIIAELVKNLYLYVPEEDKRNLLDQCLQLNLGNLHNLYDDGDKYMKQVKTAAEAELEKDFQKQSDENNHRNKLIDTLSDKLINTVALVAAASSAAVTFANNAKNEARWRSIKTFKDDPDVPMAAWELKIVETIELKEEIVKELLKKLLKQLPEWTKQLLDDNLEVNLTNIQTLDQEQ